MTTSVLLPVHCLPLCLRRSERVQVIADTTVRALLQDSETGAIKGVEFVSGADSQPQSLPAAAVVLATGGYAYDRSDSSLLKQYAPHLLTLPTTR